VPLLAVGFELRLQRRKLGERRIRIGDLFAPLWWTVFGRGTAVTLAFAIPPGRTIGTILARAALLLRAMARRARLAVLRRLGAFDSGAFGGDGCRDRRRRFGCLFGTMMAARLAMTRAFRWPAWPPHLNKGRLFRYGGRRFFRSGG